MNEAHGSDFVSGIVTSIISMIILGIVFFVIGLFLVKLLWAWTIPDLFPVAVQRGFMAGEISWLTALKIAIFVGLLGGVAGARRGRKE
ncbi:MAG: hypothetical protein AMJ73_03805 [candidate division Zixibacteria bacterium SM1_73]|nr:MAG: hypothetical protein AMJ73_03805 [candidate division Zixibacteria bacterium SM1_73]